VPVIIVGGRGDIARLVTGFSPAYHTDFWRVRRLGRAYLAATHHGTAAANLAPALSSALGNWGAGLRQAPGLQSIAAMISSLATSSVHASLVALQNSARSGLTIAGGSRAFAGLGASPPTVTTFDRNLFSALDQLANGLFIGNTNVTYPMKAVLLITGLMPAFDSQVRRGLQRGGFGGMSSTRYPLPSSTAGAGWMKISRLPFLFGECWRTYAPRIRTEIWRSRHRILVVEPGRLFDVLLFMQGDPRNPVVVTYHGQRRWYDLT